MCPDWCPPQGAGQGLHAHSGWRLPPPPLSSPVTFLQRNRVSLEGRKEVP